MSDYGKEWEKARNAGPEAREALLRFQLDQQRAAQVPATAVGCNKGCAAPALLAVVRLHRDEMAKIRLQRDETAKNVQTRLATLEREIVAEVTVDKAREFPSQSYQDGLFFVLKAVRRARKDLAREAREAARP